MQVIIIFPLAMLKKKIFQKTITFLKKKSICFIIKSSQLCLRIGFKRKKVHGILEFIQSQWIKHFVKNNTKTGNGNIRCANADAIAS